MTDIATPRDLVSDIVTNRLGRATGQQYQSVIDAVIIAIEQRDESIADALRVIGERQGLNPTMVESALVEVGLTNPPEPTSPSMPQDMPQWARLMWEQIEEIKRSL